MKQTYGCNHEDVPDPFGRTVPTNIYRKKIHRGRINDAPKCAGDKFDFDDHTMVTYNLENNSIFRCQILG